MALSLVSINIERNEHFERFLPFLTETDPDVVCFMELFERDIPRIVDVLGGAVFFSPLVIYTGALGEPLQGIGIWSRLPLRNTRERLYSALKEPGLFVEGSPLEERYAARRDVLLEADIEKDGVVYRVATTHLAWTPDGEANDHQRDVTHSLIELLKELDEHILCGDFNAPRGKEIFALFEERYKDNIPLSYTTSLDGTLHRAKDRDAWKQMSTYVVDVLFTTPEYVARDVSLKFGVSDHAAVVATIEKAA